MTQVSQPKPGKAKKGGKKIWLIVIAVVVVIWAFASCGGGDKQDDAAPAENTETTTPAEQAAEESQAPAETAPEPAAEPAPDLKALTNAWWFDDNGAFVSRYLDGLTAYAAAIEDDDAMTALGACADLQPYVASAWSSNQGISSVGLPPEDLGADVRDFFKTGELALRDTAKQCKKVFDDGKMTELQSSYENAMSGVVAFGAVKSATFDTYIAMPESEG